jgi:hypothetical protein
MYIVYFNLLLQEIYMTNKFDLTPSEPSMPAEEYLMFPDAIQKFGLDQLRPSIVHDPRLPDKGFIGSKMVVDGVAFEFDNNNPLPPKKDLDNFTPTETFHYNLILLQMAFIRSGLKVAGGDDHFSLDISGNVSDRGQSIAVYKYPGKSKLLSNFKYEVTRLLGGKSPAVGEGDNYCQMPDDRPLDHRDVNLAFDMALQDERFKELRDIADAHREKVIERARAKRRGSVAL